VWIANSTVPAYLEKIRQLAQATQVRFELKYRIEDSEIINILNRARVMLYAPRLEPFGYAPLEANACGFLLSQLRKVVRETIQDGVNGILVEHNSEDMATAIELIMRNDELFDRLSANGHHLVRESGRYTAPLDRLDSRLRETLTRVRDGLSREESQKNVGLASQNRTTELATR